MRHRVYGKKLSRSKNERLALFRGLIRSLILQGTLTTTEAKAKAIKGTVDKLITASKKNSSASLRLIESAIIQAEVAKKLIEEITPKFKTRHSGFTSTVRLGTRPGDGAMMVKMSWSKEEPSVVTSVGGVGGRQTSDKKEIKLNKTKKGGKTSS